MKIGKTFPFRPVSKRKNSQNLRKFIYDLVESEFDGDLEKACYQINERVLAYHDRRDYDVAIQPASLRKVILDYHMISYMHLNAIARYCDIPMSLIILFTRIRDELEDEQGLDSRQTLSIINGVQAFLEGLSLIEARYFFQVDTDDPFFGIGHNEFMECVARYKSAYDKSEFIAKSGLE